MLDWVRQRMGWYIGGLLAIAFVFLLLVLLRADVAQRVVPIGNLLLVIAALIGLHFTARARIAPMRELLYAKQADLIVNLFRVVGRMRVFVPMLVAPESSYKERARKDMGEAVKRLRELTDDATVLLPTELFIELKQTSDLTARFLVSYDEAKAVPEFPNEFDVQVAKTALMARALLGVDELSLESIDLFADRGALERLSKLESRDLLRDR